MAAALAGTRVEKVRGGSALSLLRSSGSKLRNFTLALSDGRTVEVVLKCPAEELKTEISFYCELAPRLKIRVPRLLGILKDHGQGSWMILEALDPGVGHASLSKNDLKEAIRTLAGLHAQFWDSKSAGGSFLPRITECDRGILHQRLEFAFDLLDRRQESLPHMPRLLDDRLKATLRRVADNPEPILAPLRALPATLLHGDPNPTNFLIDRNYGESRGIALVDWARVCHGPAIADVVSFFNYQWLRGFSPLGRFRLGADLMDWPEFAGCYFDELETILNEKVDRRAHLEAAVAADLNQTVRWRLSRAAHFLDTGVLDLFFGRFGPLLDPVARWTRVRGVLDKAIVGPLARLKQDLGILYD